MSVASGVIQTWSRRRLNSIVGPTGEITMTCDVCGAAGCYQIHDRLICQVCAINVLHQVDRGDFVKALAKVIKYHTAAQPDVAADACTCPDGRDGSCEWNIDGECKWGRG